MAYQSDTLVYGLCIYSAWRKQERLCEAMQEYIDCFSSEWILAWSILEFRRMGNDPRNLYDRSSGDDPNKKGKKENFFLRWQAGL